MQVLLVLLLSASIILLIWNVVSFYRSRRNQFNQTALADSRYYELKSKQDFLSAVFAVFVATATFLGINSLSAIETNVTKDLNARLNDSQKRIAESEGKVETISGILRSTDSTVQTYPSKFSNYDNLLKSLEHRQNQISQTTSVSEKQASDIQQRISDLNSKNILKQETYIVKDIIFDESKVDSTTFQKYYFRDLRTILNDKLPVFKKPPFVIAVSNDGASIQIVEVTKESLKLGVPQFVGLSGNSPLISNFYLSITEIP